MRYVSIILAVTLLAGCGADTLEAAATAGAIKQQELEQGEKTLEQAQRRIDAATDQMRRRQQRTAEEIDIY